MQQLGNTKMNKIFENKLGDVEKPKPDSSNETRRQYINAKYMHKKFIEPISQTKIDTVGFFYKLHLIRCKYLFFFLN